MNVLTEAAMVPMPAPMPRSSPQPRAPRGARGQDLLEHGQRARIYQLVLDEPGIHARAIASRLGLGWGTTMYHLDRLARQDLVIAERRGRHVHHFANGDARARHREALAVLRNPTALRLARAVAGSPGARQKDLCEAVGVSPSLASWHLRRLEAAGAVAAQRVGRVVRYLPGPAWQALEGLGAPWARPLAPASDDAVPAAATLADAPLPIAA